MANSEGVMDPDLMFEDHFLGGGGQPQLLSVLELQGAGCVAPWASSDSGRMPRISNEGDRFRMRYTRFYCCVLNQLALFRVLPQNI